MMRLKSNLNLTTQAASGPAVSQLELRVPWQVALCLPGPVTRDTVTVTVPEDRRCQCHGAQAAVPVTTATVPSHGDCYSFHHDHQAIMIISGLSRRGAGGCQQPVVTGRRRRGSAESPCRERDCQPEATRLRVRVKRDLN